MTVDTKWLDKIQDSYAKYGEFDGYTCDKLLVIARESAEKDAKIAEETERAESNWVALERIKEKWAADRAKIARMERIEEAARVMQEAIKSYRFVEQTIGGTNPHHPGTNRHRAFELGAEALDAYRKATEEGKVSI